MQPTDDQLFQINRLKTELFSKHFDSLGSNSEKLTVVGVQAAVDGNRDGNVWYDSYADHDLTFWYNNDSDGGTREGSPDDALDLTQVPTDASLKWIKNTRDLEDYAAYRIQLDTKLLPFSSTLTASFQLIGDAAGRTVSFFRSAGGAISTSTQHVTNDLVAGDQIRDNDFAHAVLNARSESNAGMSIEDLEPFQQGHSRYIPFLFDVDAGESKRPTNISLLLTLRDDSHSILVHRTVTLHLHDISDFYDRYVVPASKDDLKRVAFNTLNDAALGDAKPVHANIVTGSPTFDSSDRIVLVHGWNMSVAAKDSFADTMYKRLYWQGFTGHFVSFEWPTFVDDEGPFHLPAIPAADALNLTYSPSEYEALRSGRSLEHLLEGMIGYDTTILAHSMGSVVASEALRLWVKDGHTTALVKNLVAMQGAMPAGAYGVDNNYINVTASLFWPDLWRHWPTAMADDNTYYMQGTESAALNWVNLFNPQDIATSVAWPANNAGKPVANTIRPDGVWHWDYSRQRIGLLLPSWQYLRTGTATTTDLTPGLATANEDVGRTGYEILAFLAQATSLPIGTQPVNFFNPAEEGVIDVDHNIDLVANGVMILPNGSPHDRVNHSYEFYWDAAITWKFYDMLRAKTGFASTLTE